MRASCTEAQEIAPTTLVTLELSGGPVHEPVHVSEPCFHTARYYA